MTLWLQCDALALVWWDKFFAGESTTSSQTIDQPQANPIKPGEWVSVGQQLVSLYCIQLGLQYKCQMKAVDAVKEKITCFLDIVNPTYYQSNGWGPWLGSSRPTNTDLVYLKKNRSESCQIEEQPSPTIQETLGILAVQAESEGLNWWPLNSVTDWLSQTDPRGVYSFWDIGSEWWRNRNTPLPLTHQLWHHYGLAPLT